jgi:hypothetical protein
VPVTSFGVCDDVAGPPTHPAGQLGSTEDAAEVTIDDEADIDLLEGDRLVSGDVLVFQQGPGGADVGALCGLRDLQRVGGFAVIDSDVLSLDGLQSLTSVGAGLVVTQNTELRSLAGLANLVDVGLREVSGAGDLADFHVVIAGNQRVPDAEVEALRARLPADAQFVACGNAGRECNAAESALLNLLATNGLR